MAKHRGRPKSNRRAWADDMQPIMHVEGVTRTRVNRAYAAATLSLFHEDEAAHLQVFGATSDEITAGVKGFPRGWITGCQEIGRYLDTNEAARDQVKTFIVNARQAGWTFTDIGVRCRELRLGQRQGNSTSLANIIIRAVNEYRKKFPKTDIDTALRALRLASDSFAQLGSDSNAA